MIGSPDDEYWGEHFLNDRFLFNPKYVAILTHKLPDAIKMEAMVMVKVS